MGKKEFKLKVDNTELYKIKYILDELDEHVEGGKFNYSISVDYIYNIIVVIKNYIPEKHDSIINELILKYG